MLIRYDSDAIPQDEGFAVNLASDFIMQYTNRQAFRFVTRYEGKHEFTVLDDEEGTLHQDMKRHCINIGIR